MPNHSNTVNYPHAWLLLGLLCCTVPAVGFGQDNSRTSLDWVGSYEGVLPCADCPGIEVVLQLNADNSYQMSSRYQERSPKPFIEQGQFEWDGSGGVITLALPRGRHMLYRVGENRLIQLDRFGQAIEGSLADFYVLEKVATTPQPTTSPR